MAGAAAGVYHAVQFYNDDMTLARLVGAFLAEGLAAGDAAVIIATPEHRQLIEGDLRNRSVDVDGSRKMGELVILDARETLNTFMVDGTPHASTFNYVVNRVLDQVCRPHAECTIRAYGEMVDVLWSDGLDAAAIRLEVLWNELGRSRDFKLLCGHSMGNFYESAALEAIKHQHSHVVSDMELAAAAGSA